jgi:hypothetical protein
MKLHHHYISLRSIYSPHRFFLTIVGEGVITLLITISAINCFRRRNNDRHYEYLHLDFQSTER